MTSQQQESPLLIIDGFGFIFRAYHVQPPLSAPNGDPVGAIYGFTSMLIKLIGDFKPENAVIVLDHSGPNFRHELYNEYKANRPPAPDDLVQQIKMVENAAHALNFKTISKKGFEADDIIATLARQASKKKRKAIIVSSDKDLMQLTDNDVKMYDPAKSKYVTEEDIMKKFGVSANRVRDVQALMGDSSDNIPGVAGFGPKTAATLINKFGTLDNLLNSIDEIEKPRQQQLLTEHKDNALLSWQLVGLDENVEIDKTIDDFSWQAPQESQISDFLNENGFKSLTKRVESLFNVKIAQGDIIEKIKPSSAQIKINDTIIHVQKKEDLTPLINNIKISGILCLHFITEEKDLFLMLNSNNDSYKIKYEKNNAGNSESNTLFNFANTDSNSDELIELVESFLTDISIKKICFNAKNIMHLTNCKMVAYEDVQIMDYILSAGKKSKTIEEIISHYLAANITNPELISAHFTECYDALHAKLVEEKSLHLYNSIDLPLTDILFAMEQEGIKISPEILANLSEGMSRKIIQIEQNIYKLAGKEFNIGSPKQLGVILFDEMKLPFAKTSGKSNNYATGADILEKLEDEGHKIAVLILEYRHLTKLKNTYTDALPKQINNLTGRIHTSFMQCATSTGRLSSVAPNIQNIPIRTEEGNKIRSAFIASENHTLISADYSQIELKILSHVANIDSLKKAFAKKIDIHRLTASQIFDLPMEEVTSEIRRKAKAINFGIIYGISAFGLAKQLNISNKEAAQYIEKYFTTYPGIKQYMSETIEFAKTNEFIANELGRKCFLPYINNKNHSLRSFAQRAAINAPMQSLASDIVKIAMIKLQKQLKDNNFKTKMLLQIHDELILEAPLEEAEKVSNLIKETMENAYNLTIPTEVNISIGSNWMDL